MAGSRDEGSLASAEGISDEELTALALAANPTHRSTLMRCRGARGCCNSDYCLTGTCHVQSRRVAVEARVS